MAIFYLIVSENISFKKKKQLSKYWPYLSLSKISRNFTRVENDVVRYAQICLENTKGAGEAPSEATAAKQHLKGGYVSTLNRFLTLCSQSPSTAL